MKCFMGAPSSRSPFVKCFMGAPSSRSARGSRIRHRPERAPPRVDLQGPAARPRSPRRDLWSRETPSLAPTPTMNVSAGPPSSTPRRPSVTRHPYDLTQHRLALTRAPRFLTRLASFEPSEHDLNTRLFDGYRAAVATVDTNHDGIVSAGGRSTTGCWRRASPTARAGGPSRATW